MTIKRLWRFLFIAYFIFLSWQLFTPATIVSVGNWDKLIHFAGFFLLGTLATMAWQNLSTLKSILFLTSYAAFTELLQHFIPGRSLSALDWVADSLGIIVAVMYCRYLLERNPALNSDIN